MASSQDQGDQIRRQHKENGVEEIAQKQIADRLQDPMQPQGTLNKKEVRTVVERSRYNTRKTVRKHLFPRAGCRDFSHFSVLANK